MILNINKNKKQKNRIKCFLISSYVIFQIILISLLLTANFRKEGDFHTKAYCVYKSLGPLYELLALLPKFFVIIFVALRK